MARVAELGAHGKRRRCAVPPTPATSRGTLARVTRTSPLSPLGLGLLASALVAPACAPRQVEHPVSPPVTATPDQGAPGASAGAPPSAGPPPAGTTPARAPGYDVPPKAILDVMRAPSPPSPILSPTVDKALLVSWVDYPPIAQVAEPFVALAGVRLEPKTRARHDTRAGYGIRPCARGFAVAALPSGQETPVTLPKGGCPGRPSWSPDGTRFFFEHVSASAVELWVGDARTGQTKRIEGARLNPMLGSTAQWAGTSKKLVVKLVPEGQGAPPPAPAVPPGPSVQESLGQKGESSTYEARDTLKNAHDEALFDFYGASQLAVVDVDTGAVTRAGAPALIGDVDVAPDGEHALVETIERPYSYVTTLDRFPHAVSVRELSTGKASPIAKLPLADRVPVHGVPTGPRAFTWRPTEPATLYWAEALDGGDWKAKVPHRDKLMAQRAPFTAPPAEVAKIEQRYGGLQWGEDAKTVFVHEYDENRHWRRVFVTAFDAAPATLRVLFDLSTDERYANPGSFVTRALPNGGYVVRQEGGAVFLSGAGATPEGDRPFLDRMELATKATERLFRSDKAALERFVAFPAGPVTSFFTWHETPTSPPNLFLRTLAAKSAAPEKGEAAFASSQAPVTHLPDPTPQVRAIKKRLVKYKRKDGVDLQFTLYTPPGYVEGTRLPAVLYAYPLDYADAKKAGQVSGSELAFTRLRHHQFLLLAGYAVIDQAAFPIVGDPKKAYDTYLEQLVANAEAAVKKAVELGVVDPARVGVTGHSHGALMTANLVAHTKLFKAGVATSGSYNKTLTPFGFQNERRSVWDARDVYLKASTFFAANTLKLPLLIVHGEDDANPGTTPLQATKLYEALRGNGGTARLVMLPHEPHWYTAAESNEHLAAEMVRWFDTYVKGEVNSPPRAP